MCFATMAQRVPVEHMRGEVLRAVLRPLSPLLHRAGGEHGAAATGATVHSAPRAARSAQGEGEGEVLADESAVAQAAADIAAMLTLVPPSAALARALRPASGPLLELLACARGGGAVLSAQRLQVRAASHRPASAQPPPPH